MDRQHALMAILTFAFIYVIVTGAAVMHARMQVFSWSEVREAVDALSAFCTVGVGAVIGLYVASRPEEGEGEGEKKSD